MDIAQPMKSDKSQKQAVGSCGRNKRAVGDTTTYPKLFTPGHFDNHNNTASGIKRKLQI